MTGFFRFIGRLCILGQPANENTENTLDDLLSVEAVALEDDGTVRLVKWKHPQRHRAGPCQ